MIIIYRLIQILLLCIILVINNPIQAQIGYSYSDLDSIGFYNTKHDSLVNGFYLVSSCYNDLVETQITNDTIPGYYLGVKKGFWIFKRVHNVWIPSNFVRNHKIIKKIPFTSREVSNNNSLNQPYFILFRPIALQKDIIRIYEFLDSNNIHQLPYRQLPSNFIKGIIINFKNIDTTNLCKSIYDDRCCFGIGLIVDNTLISVSDTYDLKQLYHFSLNSVRFPFTGSQDSLLNKIKQFWEPNFQIIQQNKTSQDVSKIHLINNESIFINTPERLSLVDINNKIQFIDAKSEIGALHPSYPISISKELCAFPEVLSVSKSVHSISNYFIKKDNTIIEINSREKFKEIYGIVESKEEAFSYAVALFTDPSDEILYSFDFLHTTKDKYSVYGNVLKTPLVEKQENGYLVVITVRYFYGEYFEKTIFVHNTGDVELLKQEIVLINNSNHIIW